MASYRNQKSARQQLLHEFSDVVGKLLSHHTSGSVVCKKRSKMLQAGVQAGRDMVLPISVGPKSFEDNAAVDVSKFSFFLYRSWIHVLSYKALFFCINQF